MRVSVAITKGYSGRGGFPSGPYYGFELVSMGHHGVEPGTIVSVSRPRYMTRMEAIEHAYKLARRKDWTVVSVGAERAQ